MFQDVKMDESESYDFTQSQYCNSLFDKEEGSDVVFLVGEEPDVWRIPGHRSVLRKNPVFHAMFEGPLAENDTNITIKDVEGRAFDVLLRYLYNSSIQLQTVNTALATLYAAHKYLCPDLVELCVRYLDENISTETVLEIYQHLRFYSEDSSATTSAKAVNNNNNNDDNNSSGSNIIINNSNNNSNNIINNNNIDDSNVEGNPNNVEFFRKNPVTATTTTTWCCSDNYSTVAKQNSANDSLGKFKTMNKYCTSLLLNCYHFIDENADEVLKEECLEDLTREALYDIAKRDTLCLSSELYLFNALEKWSNRECKRCQLELSRENRLAVLGQELLFSVRYLLMDDGEYLEGPLKSDLFDKNENTVLLARILKKSISGVQADRLSPAVLESFGRKRNCNSGQIPIPLSKRSEKQFTVKTKTLSKPQAKKEKKEKRDSRYLDYTLNVLACIFD